MLTQYARLGAAVLSGVTASLLIATAAFAAGEDKPVVVYAEPLENVRTERVSYADLDLSQAKHERRLNYRVGRAVKRVCFHKEGAAIQDIGYRNCATGAWNGARPQIARAIEQSRQLALAGKSSIAATAITVAAAR